MLKIGVMIEGQDGLNWPRWQQLVRVVEDLGFFSLYRSDHYTNASPPDKDSLEMWVSLTWLASHTERLIFGPLVSPVSFRHPTMTARFGAAVDDLSAGRLVLGVGAGWQEREHHNYGWELLSMAERFERFEEGLEVITRLLRSDTPSEHSGRYYRLHDAILLPRPARPGGPPIRIGGNGPRRTLPLVARYASDWNAMFITSESFRELNARLNRLLEAAGRFPAEVGRSLMTGVVFGHSDADVREKMAARGRTVEYLKGRGVIVGTGQAVVDQLGVLAEAGVEEIMLQWLDLDDLDGLEGLAAAVLPYFR